MLEKVFQEITNKRKFFASSSTGEQFENNFRNELKKHFSEINGDLIEGLSHIEEKPNKEIKTTFNQLKKQVLEKNHPDTLKNPFSKLTSHFLYQPFGSQNYPDFLVFIFDDVVGIEIKFSKNEKKIFKHLAPCGIQTCLNPMRFMCMESLMQTSLFLKAQIF
ncbi:hypothetical protein HpBT135_05730 [Helicobacter pylori]